jgi:hypothetical protein
MDYNEIRRKHLDVMNRVDHHEEEPLGLIDYSKVYSSDGVNEIVQIKQKNRYSNNMCLINLNINKEYLNSYGRFYEDWAEYSKTVETGIENIWYNRKLNVSTWENPIFILLSLIDNNIDREIVPISWEDEREFMRIDCKDGKILNLNKTTNKITIVK